MNQPPLIFIILFTVIVDNLAPVFTCHCMRYFTRHCEERSDEAICPRGWIAAPFGLAMTIGESTAMTVEKQLQ